MTNENKQFKKNNTLKEEPKEIKSLNWFDKNEFKEILAIVNIRSNTISEIDAKTSLNTLNEIKNQGITTKKNKRTSKQKELLNSFNNLSDIILTDKALGSENQENENEKVESRKEENEKVESKKEENKDEDYEN